MKSSPPSIMPRLLLSLGVAFVVLYAAISFRVYMVKANYFETQHWASTVFVKLFTVPPDCEGFTGDEMMTLCQPAKQSHQAYLNSPYYQQLLEHPLHTGNFSINTFNRKMMKDYLYRKEEAMIAKAPYRETYIRDATLAEISESDFLLTLIYELDATDTKLKYAFKFLIGVMSFSILIGLIYNQFRKNWVSKDTHIVDVLFTYIYRCSPLSTVIVILLISSFYSDISTSIVGTAL